MLTSAPLLVFQDFSCSFTMETDALRVKLGVVLTQKQSDGTTRSISFKQDTTRLREELCKRRHRSTSTLDTTYNRYLCTINVNIDNQALLKTPHPSRRLTKWGLALQDLATSMQTHSHVIQWPRIFIQVHSTMERGEKLN